MNLVRLCEYCPILYFWNEELGCDRYSSIPIFCRKISHVFVPSLACSDSIMVPIHSIFSMGDAQLCFDPITIQAFIDWMVYIRVIRNDCNESTFLVAKKVFVAHTHENLKESATSSALRNS